MKVGEILYASGRGSCSGPVGELCRSSGFENQMYGGALSKLVLVFGSL